MAQKLYIPPCVDSPLHRNHPPSPERPLRIHIQALWYQSRSSSRKEIDYYGVTFDYKVPMDEVDPEVLAVNIIEMENNSGEYANGIEYVRRYLRVYVNVGEYSGTEVLAVPRCCQKKQGTTDRTRINTDVQRRV
ncbi:hypothetical protein GQ44DRAFT_787882 [Phaeosphaeriaceae sp. PMI808]|nr:hypothetical protein GQ44DRAFT_787882 [Phaeosphaeriaceae sp. PMI808]